MIKYRIDVIQALKSAGFTSYRMRKEKIIGERYLTQLRNNELVSWATIDKICALLGVQPGDLLEYVPDEKE